jgi:hypothetical protein
MEVRDLAIICSEAARAYDRISGMEESWCWDNLLPWQQDEVTAEVAVILSFVRSCLVEDDSTFVAIKLHEVWKAGLESEGWVLGDVRDLEKKTEPMLVDFFRLPEEQRGKQCLLAAIVASLSDLVKGRTEDDDGR